MVRTIQEIIQEAFSEVPTITPEKAKEEQDNGALIIDTREINELAVTGKVKKGSAAAKRRKSYCSRSAGQMKANNISCKKTPKKRICAARRRWKC